MSTFCQQFGKRNPATSAVRSKCRESENKKCHVLSFAFSQEVIHAMPWKASDFIDVERLDDKLIFKPSPEGRKLRGQPLQVEFSYSKSDLKRAQKYFGFDILVNNFWTHYATNHDELILTLTAVNTHGPT